MTTKIKRFEFEGNQVRVVMHNGDPWWVAREVCGVLGIVNATDAVDTLEKDETAVVKTYSRERGPRKTTIVSEAGLYSLIMRSHKPEAKAFKHWVTHEVIPSIMRTGSYSTPTTAPTTGLDLSNAGVAKLLHFAAEEIEARDRTIAEQNKQLALEAPKVASFDTLMSTDGLYSFEEMAKIIGGYGQNRLIKECELLGIIYSRGNQATGRREWHPYQKHVDAGRCKLITRSFNLPNGAKQEYKVVRFTPAGLNWLRQLMAVQEEQRASLDNN